MGSLRGSSKAAMFIAFVAIGFVVGVLGSQAFLEAYASGRCGNGRLDPGETCDDRNRINGDGCSAVCTAESMCGNKKIDRGERCDDGNTLANDGCGPSCKLEICGDGIVQKRARVRGGDEECDDGNRNNQDGCLNSCKFSRCGDGIVGVGEQCDDGNTRDGDGCSSVCRFPPKA